MAKKELNGTWVTIDGRHIFIEDSNGGKEKKQEEQTQTKTETNESSKKPTGKQKATKSFDELRNEHTSVFDKPGEELDKAFDNFEELKAKQTFTADQWNSADQKQRDKYAEQTLESFLKDKDLSREEILDLEDVMEDNNFHTETSRIEDVYDKLNKGEPDLKGKQPSDDELVNLMHDFWDQNDGGATGKETQEWFKEKGIDIDQDKINEIWDKTATQGRTNLDKGTPVKEYTSNFRLEAPVNDYDEAQAYLTSDDMTQYVPEELEDVITSAEWTMDDDESGHVTIKTNRELTDSEQDILNDWIDGQNSDGLGEGFEQQDFATSYFDPYSGDGPFTYAEAERYVEDKIDDMAPEEYNEYLGENDIAVEEAIDNYISENGLDPDNEDDRYDARMEVLDNPYDYFDEGAIYDAKMDAINGNPDYNIDDWYTMSSMRRNGNFEVKDISPEPGELKESLKADVIRDAGIEPGSHEESMLNNLYDNTDDDDTDWSRYDEFLDDLKNNRNKNMNYEEWLKNEKQKDYETKVYGSDVREAERQMKETFGPDFEYSDNPWDKPKQESYDPYKGTPYERKYNSVQEASRDPESALNKYIEGKTGKNPASANAKLQEKDNYKYDYKNGMITIRDKDGDEIYNYEVYEEDYKDNPKYWNSVAKEEMRQELYWLEKNEVESMPKTTNDTMNDMIRSKSKKKNYTKDETKDIVLTYLDEDPEELGEIRAGYDYMVADRIANKYKIGKQKVLNAINRLEKKDVKGIGKGTISDAIRRKAYEKYLREHPNSKMTYETFVNRNKQ